MCFVDRIIVFIQVQVSIRVLLGNQWDQNFHNICIEHFHLCFSCYYVVLSLVRGKCILSEILIIILLCYFSDILEPVSIADTK